MRTAGARPDPRARFLFSASGSRALAAKFAEPCWARHT